MAGGPATVLRASGQPLQPAMVGGAAPSAILNPWNISAAAPQKGPVRETPLPPLGLGPPSGISWKLIKSVAGSLDERGRRGEAIGGEPWHLKLRAKMAPSTRYLRKALGEEFSSQIAKLTIYQRAKLCQMLTDASHADTVDARTDAIFKLTLLANLSEAGASGALGTLAKNALKRLDLGNFALLPEAMPPTQNTAEMFVDLATTYGNQSFFNKDPLAIRILANAAEGIDATSQKAWGAIVDLARNGSEPAVRVLSGIAKTEGPNAKKSRAALLNLASEGNRWAQEEIDLLFTALHQNAYTVRPESAGPAPFSRSVWRDYVDFLHEELNRPDNPSAEPLKQAITRLAGQGNPHAIHLLIALANKLPSDRGENPDLATTNWGMDRLKELAASEDQNWQMHLENLLTKVRKSVGISHVEVSDEVRVRMASCAPDPLHDRFLISLANAGDQQAYDSLVTFAKKDGEGAPYFRNLLALKKAGWGEADSIIARESIKDQTGGLSEDLLKFVKVLAESSDLGDVTLALNWPKVNGPTIRGVLNRESKVSAFQKNGALAWSTTMRGVNIDNLKRMIETNARSITAPAPDGDADLPRRAEMTVRGAVFALQELARYGNVAAKEYLSVLKNGDNLRLSDMAAAALDSLSPQTPPPASAAPAERR